MTIDAELRLLTDEEILFIFKQVYRRGHQPNFLQSFGAALLLANREVDFRTMRPAAVIFIAKYSLGCYLVPEEGIEKSA